jgi:chloramphenicol O-acetyltransferase type A
MNKTIDLAHWNRREHFDFFRQYDEPYHGVVVNLDCTQAYRQSKQTADSFFLTYLHRILLAVNQTEAMRYRMDGESVIDFATIHCGPTIARSDHTFGFCLIEHVPDFQIFSTQAKVAMDRVKTASGLCLAETAGRRDLVYFSVLPGISFTGLSNARRFGAAAGVPYISAGQCTADGPRMRMPLAVYVHHALVDGYHLQQFLDCLASLLERE